MSLEDLRWELAQTDDCIWNALIFQSLNFSQLREKESLEKLLVYGNELLRGMPFYFLSSLSVDALIECLDSLFQNTGFNFAFMDDLDEKSLTIFLRAFVMLETEKYVVFGVQMNATKAIFSVVYK